MICKSYEELTVVEKREMIGKITHLIQTQEHLFQAMASMIRQCENSGMFEGVSFNEEENQTT